MKAFVNIAYRTVRISYAIKEIILPRSEWDKHFKNYEIFQKDAKSKMICSHDIHFKDTDEWQSHVLFDGRTIDFHYDYEERKEFADKKDWGNYLFQGYEYFDGQDQTYDVNVVDRVIIDKL